MLSKWNNKYTKQAAKWFWSIDQFIKLNTVIEVRTIEICLANGVIDSIPWNIDRTSKLTTEFILMLLENRCTLLDLQTFHYGSVLRDGFKNGIIPNLLRKGHKPIDYFKRGRPKSWIHLFEHYESLPFSLEECLEYCITKNYRFPFVVTSWRVCQVIGKNLMSWKEAVDYSLEVDDQILLDYVRNLERKFEFK